MPPVFPTTIIATMMSQGDAINQDTMAAEAAADDERGRFCSLPAPAMVQIFTFIREAQGLTGLGVASVVCKVTNTPSCLHA